MSKDKGPAPSMAHVKPGPGGSSSRGTTSSRMSPGRFQQLKSTSVDSRFKGQRVSQKEHERTAFLGKTGLGAIGNLSSRGNATNLKNNSER